MDEGNTVTTENKRNNAQDKVQVITYHQTSFVKNHCED